MSLGEMQRELEHLARFVDAPRNPPALVKRLEDKMIELEIRMDRVFEEGEEN